jgi:hypothetical protein
MPVTTDLAPVSKQQLWAGRVVSGLVVLFLGFDSIIKIIAIQPVVDSFVPLGYSASIAVPLGILLLACTVLYAIPRTSVLGALLLVGYLGGATATHVRIGEPFYFPIAVGVLAWLGLYLRDRRVRALVPLRA